jgi:trk system potassium uptake protein TrkH
MALAGIMLIPLMLAIHYEFFADPASHLQPHSTIAFLESIAVCLLAGLICYLLGKNSKERLFKKEVIILVVLIWFLTPALTGLPYLLSGTLSNFWDAYFESASGLTTTGSTIFQAKEYNAVGEEIPIEKTFGNVRKTHYKFYGTLEPVKDPKTNAIIHEGVEAVSKALLFWRSLVEWIGGGGIIVLFVAVLPSLGISGKALFQTEIAGPSKDSITPRVQTGAIHLWLIYTMLTLAQIIILKLSNEKMDWLDVVTVSFGSLSTGGLSIKNANIGAYDSSTTDWIIILFMYLGSINFSLYYYAFRGKVYKLYDKELLVYTLSLIILSTISAWYLIGEPLVLLTGETREVFSTEDAFRYGFFQIVSSQSTTGYYTADYDGWPILVQALMLLVMYLGGMSGSTAGGMKIIRSIMIFRIVKYKAEEVFRPQKVRKLKIAGQEISPAAATGVLSYFWLLITISVLGTLAYIIDNIDMETSFGLVACLINNSGLAFRMAGPTESCAFMSDFSLVVSSILILMGRLEFLTILTLFIPAFWKENV